MVTIVKDYSSDRDQNTVPSSHSTGRSLRQRGSGLGTSATAAAKGPRISMRLHTFFFLIFITFVIARMTVHCNRSYPCVSTMRAQTDSDTVLKGICKVWVRYRSHAEPIRLTLGCDRTWASVKPAIKDTMRTSLDRQPVDNIILLHPVHGKVDLNSPVGGQYRSQVRKPLIAFFDDPETRIMLKQRTSIPVKVTAELCFRRDQKSDDPYVVLYRILSDQFTKDDVNTMRRTLCQSSFEVSSWQGTESNKHDRLASAYSYVFKRRG